MGSFQWEHIPCWTAGIVLSHLQVRCEESVVAAHQRDSQSRGRPGFQGAGLLLSPSGQQVSLLEEPQEFCSADLRPRITCGVLESGGDVLLLLLALLYCLHTGYAVIYWICLPLIQVSVSWQCAKSPLAFFLARSRALHPSYSSKL